MATIEEHEYKIYTRPSHDTEDDDKTKLDVDYKDKKIIDDALQRIRNRNLTNTKDYIWELMNKEYQYHQKQSENRKQNTKDKLSKLIDDSKKEMCVKGHARFSNYKKEELIGQFPCVMCGSMKERRYCGNCYSYGTQRSGKKKCVNAAVHIYCQYCRIRNAESIKKRIAMDRFKAEIIRNELIETPELELDLLCNMPRRASLDTLIKDINKLSDGKRSKWCLFVFDLDHLKIWNTCLGHVKTDSMINKIGNEMKNYVQEINNGKWNDEEKGKLVESFAFRTGGDEFCFAVKTGSGYANGIPLGSFYFSIKKDINNIGLNIKDLFCEKEEKEYKNAMEALDNAKDRNTQRINMNKLGISTGLFIPYKHKVDDWLYFGDKKALEHAKTLNPPMKNEIAIYYEKIGGLIPDEKTLKCLQNGIFKGLKST